MDLAGNRQLRVLFSGAIVVLLVAFTCVFVAACREFPPWVAVLVSVPLTLPILVVVRLRCRWHAVSRKDVATLVVLLLAAMGVSASVAREARRNFWNKYHTDDLRWAEFERRFRQDAAFREVRACKTVRKNIHWAEGKVDGENDLIRLRALAVECGITRERLDGPYAHSVSLSVRQGVSE